jgi:hypothetical protein
MGKKYNPRRNIDLSKITTLKPRGWIDTSSKKRRKLK